MGARAGMKATVVRGCLALIATGALVSACGDDGGGNDGGAGGGAAGEPHGGTHASAGSASQAGSGGTLPPVGGNANEAGTANGGVGAAGAPEGDGGRTGVPEAGAGGAIAGAMSGGAGEAGAGGETAACATKPDVQLAAGHCFTKAQCASGQSCSGTQSAKLCVPRSSYCDESAHCPEGQYCQAHACVAAAAIGSPCSPGERCAVGAYCGPDYTFDGTYWDATGPIQCRARRDQFTACDYQYDSCKAGMVCSPNRLLDDGEPFDYCIELRGAQGDCRSDDDCKPGLLCHFQDDVWDSACYVAQPLGGECSTSLELHWRCDVALFCGIDPETDLDWGCEALPSACAPCSPTARNVIGARCDAASYCANDVCQAKARIGQACDVDPCADGLVCVTAQVDGTCQN